MTSTLTEHVGELKENLHKLKAIVHDSLTFITNISAPLPGKAMEKKTSEIIKRLNKASYSKIIK